MSDDPDHDDTHEVEGPGKGNPNGGSPRIPNHRLDAVALLQLQGTSGATIARMTGLGATTVQALIEGRNDTYNRILDAFRQKLFDGLLRDQMQLIELLPECYGVWKRTLTGDNLPLANETAWKIHDRLIPPSIAPQGTPGGITVNIASGNTKVENQFTTMLGELPKRLESILSMSTVDPNRYLRTETEALPAAASVPETIEVHHGSAPEAPDTGTSQ